MLENTAVGNACTSITRIHEGIVFGSHLHSIKSCCVDFEFDTPLNLKSPSRTLSKSWCFTSCLRPQVSPSFEIILSQVCLKHSHTFWWAWATFQGYRKAKTPARDFFFLVAFISTLYRSVQSQSRSAIMQKQFNMIWVMTERFMQVFMGFN